MFKIKNNQLESEIKTMKQAKQQEIVSSLIIIFIYIHKVLMTKKTFLNLKILASKKIC